MRAEEKKDCSGFHSSLIPPPSSLRFGGTDSQTHLIFSSLTLLNLNCENMRWAKYVGAEDQPSLLGSVIKGK
jgi:hypothetical protein